MDKTTRELHLDCGCMYTLEKQPSGYEVVTSFRPAKKPGCPGGNGLPPRIVAIRQHAGLPEVRNDR